MIKRFIDKMKLKFELQVARGMISEIMEKADWDLNNLDSVELNKVKKMSRLISAIESNM